LDVDHVLQVASQNTHLFLGGAQFLIVLIFVVALALSVLKSKFAEIMNF
jgi:hypothetical protein